MRTLLLVSAVAAAAFASAQPVAKGFTYGRVDDTLPWKHLGWYDQNRFLLFDAELNGLSARSIEQRYAVLAASNRFAKVWTNEENEKPLAAQSKAWTAAHPQSGLGKKVFQYGGPYVTASGLMPPVSSMRSSAGFIHGGRKYSLELTQRADGPWEKDPDANPGFRRANFTLRMRQGVGNWLSLQDDGKRYPREALQYGIDQVWISPNGKTLAVYLTAYTCGFFEGWNVAIERMVVTGRLP
ncbi:MAG TPA: hypothetical protein PLH94_14945 [Fimbriimonadaceae bacterium]|nr:hypothetical protein [Fimbriimonadaceae bacterium]